MITVTTPRPVSVDQTQVSKRSTPVRCEDTVRCENALLESPHSGAFKDVSVNVEGKKVVLSGRVLSYYEKSMAQETIKQAIKKLKQQYTVQNDTKVPD